MLLDSVPLPSTWKRIKPVQKPEYRIIPLESYGLEGGFVAFEMNNPENIGISGAGKEPLEALSDLLSKLGKEPIN